MSSSSRSHKRQKTTNGANPTQSHTLSNNQNHNASVSNNRNQNNSNCHYNPNDVPPLTENKTAKKRKIYKKKNMRN